MKHDEIAKAIKAGEDFITTLAEKHYKMNVVSQTELKNHFTDSKVELTIGLIKSLKKEDRLRVFSRFCEFCGRYERDTSFPCKCWDDL